MSGRQSDRIAHEDRRADAVPQDYWNLDELAAPVVYDSNNRESGRCSSYDGLSARRSEAASGNSSGNSNEYENLDELRALSPLPKEQESSEALEDVQRQDLANGTAEGLRDHEIGGVQQASHRQDAESSGNARSEMSSHATSAETASKSERRERASRFATELYTVSYLILFAILGTLARLGLQALTFYPGAPVIVGELWANFGGSLIMGFLSEDRQLFKEEWGRSQHDRSLAAREPVADEESSRDSGSKPPQGAFDTDAEAKEAHAAAKKTIPLYIGLATGFCGSFTSFSSFIRDAFLAISNNLAAATLQPASSPASFANAIPRNNGYSVAAVSAMILLTVCLCTSALVLGAHLALAVDELTPTLRFAYVRKLVDRAAVVLAWGCWLGAILMAIWPPDRPSGPSGTRTATWSQEHWRGQVLFSLVFAPVGCLTRFYVSLHLNGRIASFPLGTFVANIGGTIILGLAWDLQHAPLPSAAGQVGGGRVSCQVLQGIMDGFCGCLTTVSTWVLELKSLRRWHSYRYGATSVVIGLASLVVIMGSLRWTRGFSPPVCS
ncbi:MAG: hypothetical protein M1833_006857 [Piccolia ochrophora]|nr:MAG: hypothetical protein M1833_006857 [Piccolia ochrophora]